jgi:hypothetical protein
VLPGSEDHEHEREICVEVKRDLQRSIESSIDEWSIDDVGIQFEGNLLLTKVENALA